MLEMQQNDNFDHHHCSSQTPVQFQCRGGAPTKGLSILSFSINNNLRTIEARILLMLFLCDLEQLDEKR